jgi:CheY-like chemotaxis protein
MYSPPPLRGRPVLDGKKVLLIDRCQATREVRASVLQSHDVEVHLAEDFSTARFLWQPDTYDLILLDVRRYMPGEVLEFYEQIKVASPPQCFAFLVGAPAYLSLTWPRDVRTAETESQQWAETMKRFMTAA